MSMVLVIEDDRTQRLAAVLALRKAEHHVIEAEDGARGLALARECTPDLIVCDVMMPGMNGYQFVTALRADPAISDIPVIMLTAMAEPAAIRVGMTSGADDYLAKPFRVQVLCEAADSLILRRRTQRQRIVGALKAKFEVELDEQKQVIARQYETRMLQELNRQWDASAAAGQDSHHPRATVLLFDLIRTVEALTSQPQAAADLLRHAMQSARDTLYLFGAQHLQAYGSGFLAVFLGDGTPANSGPPQAVRAGAGLLKALPMVLGLPSDTPCPLTLALAEGEVDVVQFTDALHGDGTYRLVLGTATREAVALLAHAQAKAWTTVADQALARSLHGLGVRIGRRASISVPGRPEELQICECLGVG